MQNVYPDIHFIKIIIVFFFYLLEFPVFYKQDHLTIRKDVLYIYIYTSDQVWPSIVHVTLKNILKSTQFENIINFNKKKSFHILMIKQQKYGRYFFCNLKMLQVNADVQNWSIQYYSKTDFTQYLKSFQNSYLQFKFLQIGNYLY